MSVPTRDLYVSATATSSPGAGRGAQAETRRNHAESRPTHNSSIRRLLSRMLALADAQKTMASILGCAHTYASASRGWIAPEANTDIAMGRNRRVAIACS